MKRVNLVALSLMLVLAFAISSAFAAHDEGMQTIEGNVICLLPDYNKGNVKPVISNGPCDKLPPHAHVLVTKEGKVYALEGSEEAMHKLEMSSERKNVKLTGRVEGNQRAWILHVK
ncbi:MAG: hypothetical protein ACM3SR_06705 [Ignavibacteriales bacterium]